jgi:Bacterial PH domain
VDEWPEDLIRSELGPGEHLLWAGRPRQGFVLRAIDGFLIPFSLLWGGFAIFWEVMVVESGGPWFFALWGIPFVVIGLYLIIGRFWLDSRQRAHTFYGVTSERVVIVSGLFSRQTKSLSLETLSDVTLTERSDGSGTITFGPLPPFYGWYATAGWPGFGYPFVPSFDLACEVRPVYEIIQRAQRAAKHQD